MDETELVELGRHLQPRVSGPFEIDGQTAGNLEMLALIRAGYADRLATYEAEGICCTEGPYTSGHCRYGFGKCHLVQLAQTIRRKALRHD